ncbi:MAG TPA: hypothetical protein V6C81_12600 [Planktothrix sp.]|jgi:hypothetical protein
MQQAMFNPIDFPTAWRFAVTEHTDATDQVAVRAINVRTQLGSIALRLNSMDSDVPMDLLMAQIHCDAALQLLRDTERYDFLPPEPIIYHTDFMLMEPSGSMKGPQPTVEKRIETVNRHLDEVERLCKKALEENPHLAPEESPVELDRWFNPEPGSTDLSAAVELMEEMLERQMPRHLGAKFVFFVTDGDPSSYIN